jgi:hypothetical protein
MFDGTMVSALGISAGTIVSIEVCLLFSETAGRRYDVGRDHLLF